MSNGDAGLEPDEVDQAEHELVAFEIADRLDLNEERPVEVDPGGNLRERNEHAIVAAADRDTVLEAFVLVGPERQDGEKQGIRWRRR